MVPAVVGFILGLVLGSFIQATAGRIISGRTLRGRSYCMHCRKSLRWYDLFPVISFLLLKGKCRSCRHKIPREDFLVELVFGFIIAFFFWTTFPTETLFNLQFDLSTALLSLDVVFKTFAVVVLALVFLIDWKTGLIPDRITYPATVVAIIYLLVSTALKSWVFYQSFLLSPLAIYLMPPKSSYVYDHLSWIWIPVGWTLFVSILITLSFIALIVATRGKGMGWGDVKYVFFLGVAIGFPIIIPAIFLAFLTGAFFSLGLIATGRKSFGQTVPFGPFLSLGALVALLFGKQIIDWYLNIF